MSKKRAFEERGWNDSLDLPYHLRRGLSGMYVFHKFPGEEKATPTCMEDCSDSTIRGWLHIKPSVAVNYIGRNRTLMYPYKRAVSDLRDVNAQFRVDCNAVYESTFDHFDCDYGRT